MFNIVIKSLQIKCLDWHSKDCDFCARFSAKRRYNFLKKLNRNYEDMSSPTSEVDCQ
jgi:hypothetical protein